MTRPKEGGSVARRIALDLQDAQLRVARLLKLASDDITDGDNDTRTAQKALSEVNLINFEMFAVNGKIADGALRDAETVSMRLASGEKRD